MHVLLVKISSMGDLIHALPAITDAANALPGIRFDWVIEKSFKEVASWHPAVDCIIPSSHRVWKRNLKETLTSGQLKRFIKQLRSRHYDLILDGQSSIKSAVISRFAKGERAGLDSRSVREYGAHWAYKHRYSVQKNIHAITRLRILFAQSLGYDYPTSKPDFGLDTNQFPAPDMPIRTPYLVFLVNASWLSKCYPESYWQELLQLACKEYTVYIPWGSAAEAERAQRLAKCHSYAIALPKLSLSEIGNILNNAQGTISVDTGLGHLAAALNTPTVTLYGPTNPNLIGAIGAKQIYCQADFECLKCYRKQCHYHETLHTEAMCLKQLQPAYVWQQLQSIVRRTPNDITNQSIESTSIS